MTYAAFDVPTLIFVSLGALVAGFTTGFAGFGTGLVASGLWYLALPAAMVPPVVALASVAAQLVGIVAVRKSFDWRRTTPFLLGAAIGVPLGVAALTMASPDILKTSIGAFLVVYVLVQLGGIGRWAIGDRGGRTADGAIGAGGGFLGGFAGLSGPLPVVWLQLRGGTGDQRRATYQPFNLVVLSFAGIGMAIGGRIDGAVLSLAVLCLPVTLAGAWIGARIYIGIGEETFRKAVLILLLASGALLIAQTVVKNLS